MTGVFRPRGGRPNKVTKSPPTARRPSRQQQQSLAIAADQAIHHPSLHDGDVGPPDNPDPGDEHHHHHHQHHHLHHHQDGVNDDGILSDSMGKSDAEMGDGSAHVDSLSAAANILTNGAGMLAAVAADDHSGVPAEYATLPPPQLDEQDFDGASRTTQEMARDSGYANVLVESALAKRLARQPALRHAHQRRPEQQLNLSRRSNVEALFAHVAGDELATSCKNCRKGHGPWTACVVVDGQMCGSCANCWFNASGARCSFHETKTGPIPGIHTAQQHPQQPQQQPLPQHHMPGVHATGSASIPDAHSYSMSSPMALAPSGPSIAGVNLGAALSLNDPTVAFAMERAFAEVRGADIHARNMMMIEIHAKQLALSIIAREEARVESESQGVPPGLGNEGAD